MPDLKVKVNLVENETKEICQKLLANPVIENFDYEIEELT
jgi:phosphoribosylformylglycinamidine (FGAM) synthase PurS component